MSLNKHLIQIKDFPEYSVDELGGHANAILACCNGRYKQHHGYSFEWI